LQASLKEPTPPGAGAEPAPTQATSITRKPEDQGEPKIPEVLAILPVRNLVLFPRTVTPLSIGRADSIKLFRCA